MVVAYGDCATKFPKESESSKSEICISQIDGKVMPEEAPA